MICTMEDLQTACEANGVDREFAWATSLSIPELYRSIFGRAGKVACPTYGLRPVVSCPSLAEGEGMVCSDCYAKRGRYGHTSSRKAHIRRMVAFLADPALWRRAVTGQAMGAVTEHIRLHDSGDFFSTEYLQGWIDVARQVPEVSFFAPTRTWRDETFLPLLQEANALPNFVVRPSAMIIDGEEFEVEGLAGATLVTMGEGTCPAANEHSNCEEVGCRKCWDHSETMIRFTRHY